MAYFETRDPFIHENAGYIVLVLVALRVVWGFCGPEHARFASFIRSPTAAVRYLGGLSRGRAKRYLGHNPAGGWMVVMLLVMITVSTVSGMVMITHRFWGDPLVEDIHGVSSDITVGLVAVHVLGVLASSVAHRENLSLAMVTGRKPLDKATPRREAESVPRPCIPCAPGAPV